jgi:hypothetical protein
MTTRLRSFGLYWSLIEVLVGALALTPMLVHPGGGPLAANVIALILCGSVLVVGLIGVARAVRRRWVTGFWRL